MSHEHSSANYLYIAAAAVVVILLIVVANRDVGPSRYDTFAQCVSDNGAKMWGAWWCPHCSKQKALFEGAFDKINYVECSSPGTRTMTQQCKDDGIEGYPTWQFSDGNRVSGEQSLETLAQKTGCVLPDGE